ncbi:hypothetical protein QYE76_071975 [Lolium multiflorum]|uniref:Dehydrogenase E1 component domain-containing protein n=1 Tax=Lolium multiflorum TaxID=4521 RepID=A0AAD8QHW3_LOLMU|nr:hypothetical protein QYE76_071975 [Lolium multiflorum]
MRSHMAAWLAGASSKLAHSAARRLAGDLRRRGPGPWLLSSSTVVPARGQLAGDQLRGFCSVRRFAGDSTAATAAEESGNEFAGGDLQQVGKELALKMYSNMVTVQIMDTIFYEVQRQGRISFYITSNGEEAINIASAAALSADDIVLPQVNFS